MRKRAAYSVAIPIRIVAAVATLNRVTWSRKWRSGARFQRPCATITAPLVNEIEAMEASGRAGPPTARGGLPAPFRAEGEDGSREPLGRRGIAAPLAYPRCR